MPQDEVRSGLQLEGHFIGALGDDGIAAQRDQLLDAVPRLVPYLNPEVQGIDRAHTVWKHENMKRTSGKNA